MQVVLHAVAGQMPVGFLPSAYCFLGGSTASLPLINMLIQGAAMLVHRPNCSELALGWDQAQHIRIPCLKFGTW